VKWFNAKAGYGFVTVQGPEGEGVDGQEQQKGSPRGVDGQEQQKGSPREVFIHHSGLRVGKEQFRYLVEGEYVELEVKEMVGEGGALARYQGIEVRGIGGGLLMCETRNEASASASQYKSEGVQRSEGVRREGVRNVGARREGVRREGVRSVSEKDRKPQRERKTESVAQQMRHKPKSELD
jgi:cold shock CspA family protein